MDTLSQTPASIAWTLVCAHTAVTGRLRLKVYPKPRDPTHAAHIVNKIRSTEGVLRIDVNRTTGTALVAHDRAISHTQMLQRIAGALPGRLLERVRPAEPIQAVATTGHLPKVPARSTPHTSEIAWHTLEAGDVERTLTSSSVHGLSADQAAQHLQAGANILPTMPAPTLAALLWRQIGNLPTGLLAGSAFVSIATGGVADAVAIAAVVAINAVIGLRTEAQAEKIIRSLAIGAPATAAVIRDGRPADAALQTIVPGDLLLLSVGDYVAADARVIDTDNLSVDESALTGESLPVFKEHHGCLAADTALAERRNMVYRGTVITGGSGRALVVATGIATELGRIQESATNVAAPPTPLQQQMERTGATLVRLSAAACAGVLVLGLARRLPWLNLVNLSISLSVAAIPEGLPAVATSTLALGVRRMSARRVAIRRLGAIEAVGSMDTLCFDKTGTLTQNRMQVECLQSGVEFIVPLADGIAPVIPERPELQRLLEMLVLCNDASLDTHGGAIGSATEGALLELAHRAGISVTRLREKYPRVGVHYRAENRRFMTTSHRTDYAQLVAAKGSPAELLTRAQWILDRGQRMPLSEEHRRTILRWNEEWAARGLRVLGVAYAEINTDSDGTMEALVWLGLVALSDPPRPGVAAVVARLHAAGVRPIMITGDQAATAASIGAQIALAPGTPLRVVEASEASRLAPEVLRALAERTHVFARATPALKLAIVRALQDGGRIVGMTGDGINDGPALRAANVGFAMGGAQQDVAKSVSDIVLEDDELDTMLAAIAEGRTIYDNVRKAMHYLLATNFSEIQIMLAALAVGVPVPLNSMQLLWINLLTDIFPALGLALEPAEADVLETGPRDPQQPLLGRRDAMRLARESLLLSGATFGGYLLGIRRYGAGPQASTYAFATLTLAQLLHALSCRSDRVRLLEQFSRPRNRVLDLALLGTAGAQIASLFLPWTRQLLGTSRLGFVDLGIIGALSVTPLAMNEVINAFQRRALHESRSTAARSGDGTS